MADYLERLQQLVPEGWLGNYLNPQQQQQPDPRLQAIEQMQATEGYTPIGKSHSFPDTRQSRGSRFLGKIRAHHREGRFPNE